MLMLLLFQSSFQLLFSASKMLWTKCFCIWLTLIIRHCTVQLVNCPLVMGIMALLREPPHMALLLSESHSWLIALLALFRQAWITRFICEIITYIWISFILRYKVAPHPPALSVNLLLSVYLLHGKCYVRYTMSRWVVHVRTMKYNPAGATA